jgi:hypothetical protein
VYMAGMENDEAMGGSSPHRPDWCRNPWCRQAKRVGLGGVRDELAATGLSICASSRFGDEQVPGPVRSRYCSSGNAAEARAPSAGRSLRDYRHHRAASICAMWWTGAVGYEDPSALLGRLRLGREEFCQRLLTMLIVDGLYPRWNTDSVATPQGWSFLEDLYGGA